MRALLVSLLRVTDVETDESRSETDIGSVRCGHGIVDLLSRHDAELLIAVRCPKLATRGVTAPGVVCMPGRDDCLHRDVFAIAV